MLMFAVEVVGRSRHDVLGLIAGQGLLGRSRSPLARRSRHERHDQWPKIVTSSHDPNPTSADVAARRITTDSSSPNASQSAT